MRTRTMTGLIAFAALIALPAFAADEPANEEQKTL